MKIKVKEILNHFITNYKDELVSAYTISGNTLEDCFKSVYEMRRSARYDNGRRYDFEDPSMEERFQEWKRRNETIEMYYGSATVD